MHLAKNSLVISYQIAHLPLKFSDSTVHTVVLSGCSSFASCYNSGNVFPS